MERSSEKIVVGNIYPVYDIFHRVDKKIMATVRPRCYIRIYPAKAIEYMIMSSTVKVLIQEGN
jgi:hypothetical protein